MKKFIEEFKKFALRGNVMDMAVGVIIGGAFKSIADSLVSDIINPILGIFTGGSSDLSGLSFSLPGGGELMLGNFINAELWGKVTDSPLGMIFPGAGPLPRHPSQLYEAGLEGVLTFVILWIYSSRPRPRGAVAGLFGVLYAVSRIAVEFFRVPDAQLGYLFAGWVTMGQILCLPLLAAGLWLLWRVYRPGAGA